jgi:hypothetical protein
MLEIVHEGAECFKLLLLDLFRELGTPSTGKSHFTLDGQVSENIFEIFYFH